MLYHSHGPASLPPSHLPCWSIPVNAKSDSTQSDVEGSGWPLSWDATVMPALSGSKQRDVPRVRWAQLTFGSGLFIHYYLFIIFK